MKIENECRVDFQYRMSPYSPVVIKTVCSNVVSTDIVTDMLRVDKYVDKEFINAFEILTYSIDIINTSKLFITNVFFYDKIPLGTKFIENSVTVKYINKRCFNPEVGFYVGNIKVGSKVRISFKVVVLPQCFTNNIQNYSQIQYDYIYNIEERPIRTWINSNEVNSKNKNEVYKQITVNNSLKTPDIIENLVHTKVNVSIQQIKIVQSPVGNFDSTKPTNLCTLVIIGKIKYELLYTSTKTKKNKKIANERVCDLFGFSCFMLVPVGVNYLDKNKIEIKIENISTHIVDENTIFASTNLLIYY